MRAHEFIDEIYSYPPAGESLFKYEPYFKDDSRSSTPFGNLTFSNVQANDSDYFGLLHDDQPISILHIDIRDGSAYHQITYTETDKNHRRQGCFRYLLLKAVEKYSTIISDTHQTKDAEDSWRSLIQYPSDRLQFKMYDTSNDAIEDIDTNKVWNNTGEYVLLVTNAHFTTEMLEKSNARDKYTKFSNTHFEGMWFGEHTSGNGYINP